MTVVDHEHGHCGNAVGCLACVRGQGHRTCNVMEGSIRKAILLGIVTNIEGPLREYLADPPMRKWAEGRKASPGPKA